MRFVVGRLFELLLALRSTWAHTAEGQRLEPAPPKQIENIRCCETHGRPGQSGPRLQALDVYTRKCEPSAPSPLPPQRAGQKAANSEWACARDMARLPIATSLWPDGECVWRSGAAKWSPARETPDQRWPNKQTPPGWLDGWRHAAWRV